MLIGEAGVRKRSRPRHRTEAPALVNQYAGRGRCSLASSNCLVDSARTKAFRFAVGCSPKLCSALMIPKFSSGLKSSPAVKFARGLRESWLWGSAPACWRVSWLHW